MSKEQVTLEAIKIKPYKTAHERLLEIGYECYETIHSGRQYINTEEDETLPVEIYISRHSKYYYILDNDGVSLELSRILTQYLEELAREWYLEWQLYYCVGYYFCITL